MAKRRENFSSEQADLFQRLTTDALEVNAQDLDIHLELLGAINEAIREGKKRGLSRERIVERMNLCLPDLEKPITVRQFYAWTAQSKEYSEFPARYLPAFCWATGSILPLVALAKAINYELVDRRDRAALELGTKAVQHAQLAREISHLKKQLEN